MKHLVRIFSLAAALVAASLANPAWAAIQIDGAWAKQDGKRGSVFLTIHNTGSTPDHLFAIKCNSAMKAMLHHGNKQSAKKMNRMMAVIVPPGAKVSFKPGSHHIMLMGLKNPLKAGGTVSLKLFFKKAGTVEVTAKIR